MKTGRVKHIITDFECDSNFLDKPCEVCGQKCQRVFHLLEEKEYRINPTESFPNGHTGWTRHDCKNLTGHEKCLQDYSKKRLEGKE